MDDDSLLKFDADWRWLLERHDSPWYPSMRLFRQPRPKAWDAVVSEIINEFDSGLPFRASGGGEDTAEPTTASDRKGK